ncbi:hypothetical protein LIER_20213 [Lithospermum erythrorhizon]|uniref:Uncharacterized protein n=1 Tax=Lithospermum erythrorhizon TaxID=34254 RepID=A0AAV3QKP9_LITER
MKNQSLYLIGYFLIQHRKEKLSRASFLFFTLKKGSIKKMESEEQLELTQKALKHFVDEEKIRSSEEDSSPDHESSVKVDDDDHHHPHLLLPNLLSQGDDSLKHNDMVEQLDEPANSGKLHPLKSSQQNETANEVASSDDEIMTDNKEILKELREIKKQNKRTHWLLSTMIVLTLTWQLSEVSLLFKLKEGITNPFKTIGNVFTEIISKRRKALNGHGEQNGTAEEKQDSSSILPQWPQGS